MSNQSIFFSIILPTYNRADLLPKAIESVLSQNFNDWELLIIDDASNDQTEEVANRYNEARIQYLKNERNIERSASRNRGINVAKGKYICFLDSDDYYLENHLEEFYKFIESSHFPEAMLYCNSYYEVQGELEEGPDNLAKTKNGVEQVLLNMIAPPRACIHHKILAEFQFNPEYSIGEDLDLGVRIARKYPIMHNNVYSIVRLSHEGRSVNLHNLEPFTQHIDRIKQILIEDGQRYISNEVKKEILAEAHFNLGRHYLFKKQKVKAIQILVKSLAIYPKRRWKEVLYMLLQILNLKK